MLTARPGLAMLVSTVISMPPSLALVAIASTAWFVVRLATHRIRLSPRVFRVQRLP